MNEIVKLILGALLASIPAYYIMFSQRRKNLSEGDASSAEAAAKLNAQTIAMIGSMRTDLAQQKHNTEVLQDKVYLLEQQLKNERRANVLYKEYINYLLHGSEDNRAQIEEHGSVPVFIPITLQAFEAAHNA